MSKHSIIRWGKIMGTYLLVAAVAALGWLWCALPEEVYLEPEQTLTLPRFGWVEPLRGHGSRNVASTRAAGSYQTTLALGGWLPVKTIRATVMQRPTVTVCGTPFGVKMFSEGALVVGFSEVHTAAGTINPAKQAGLRLGDRVIRMGNTVTETNEQVHAALEAAAGAAVEVVYVRKGEQRQTTLLPVWDTQNAQWRAGMWVRDSSAGVGTLTFVDVQAGVFAGLGHPISDSDTGERVALRSGEIVACQIVGLHRRYRRQPRGAEGQIYQRPRHWKNLRQRRKWRLRHGKHCHCRAADRACFCAGGAARRGRDPDHHQRRNAPQLPCLYRKGERR